MVMTVIYTPQTPENEQKQEKRESYIWWFLHTNLMIIRGEDLFIISWR